MLAVAFPVGAGIVGGIIAAFKPPDKVVASAVQHFAAGVVLAAVTTEIVPDMLHGSVVGWMIIGFAAGVALMLCLAAVETRMESKGAGSVGILAVVGVDLLIDGMLIGVSFLAGGKQGKLITLALTLEILFLGLSVAAVMARESASRGRIIASTSILSLLVPVGAAISVVAFKGLPTGPMTLILAFAAAALLFLVVEELIVEAHESAEERWWLTAMFFAGFLVIAVIELVA